jgi:2-oxo-4-hydroxy-4-carboxy-5-ureidoimidazoline decarboxylase
VHRLAATAVTGVIVSQLLVGRRQSLVEEVGQLLAHTHEHWYTKSSRCGDPSRSWSPHIFVPDAEQRRRAGRPSRRRGHHLAAAEAACRELDDAELDLALAGHPRIGDRASGSGTEAEWSRQEQASVSDADRATREELDEANRAYDRRFGHVFLIRAAGRSATEMLAELHRRLGNDPATERREVVDQLAQITRLRVERLLGS